LSLLVNPEQISKAIEFCQSQILKSRYQVVRVFAECLSKKIDTPQVKRAWKSVVDSIICEPGETDATVLRIAYDQEGDCIDEEEKNVEPFSEQIKKLNSLSGYVDLNKIDGVLTPFFKSFLKTTDRLELETALSKLADLAHNTKFNKLKLLIMQNIDEAIKHYLIQVFSGADSGAINFDMELIARFAEVKSNASTASQYGLKVSHSGKEVVARWKERTGIYKKLKAGKMSVSDNTFWDDFDIEKLLFLRATASIIEANQIERLLKIYKQQGIFNSFHGVLEDLLLQVEEKGAVKVLEYFIEKKNNSMIKRICDKFIRLKLARGDLEKLYQEHVDLFWLERTGIVLSLGLRQLNISMVNNFISILDPESKAINGFHTGYAKNIFDGYLLPMLDICRTSKTPYVDPFSLLIMFTRFAQFYQENHLVDRITSKQMLTTLCLLQRNIDHPLVTVDRLKQSLRMLAQLVDIFKLTLVRVGDNLLVQDPLHDFNCSMEFQRGPEIILILSRLLKDSKSDVSLDCSRIIEYINSREQQKLTPQFAQTASYHRLKREPEVAKTRKRSNSFNC